MKTSQAKPSVSFDFRSFLPRFGHKASTPKNTKADMEPTTDAPVKISLVTDELGWKRLFHIAADDYAENQLFRAMHKPLTENQLSSDEVTDRIAEATKSRRPFDMSLGMTAEGAAWHATQDPQAKTFEAVVNGKPVGYGSFTVLVDFPPTDQITNLHDHLDSALVIYYRTEVRKMYTQSMEGQKHICKFRPRDMTPDFQGL
jgi:hypothetical protein